MKRRAKAWLAVPISVDMGAVRRIAEDLSKRYEIDVEYWDRGRYDERKLLDSDFLIVYNENKFDGSVPPGVHREITAASTNNIDLALAYAPRTDNDRGIYLYKATFVGSQLKGFGGRIVGRIVLDEQQYAGSPDVPRQDLELLLLLC